MAQKVKKATSSSLPEFPNPFDVNGYEDGVFPYTLVELNMMYAMGSIKDKPDWFNKINNPVVVNKWKSELKKQGMHESQIKYIIDELTYYAKSASKTMSPSPVDGVWQSDEIIPEDLRLKLSAEVSLLENSSKGRDWHPGSNEMMLDLVHPSLYPYVAGLSKNREGNTVAKFGSGPKPKSHGFYEDNGYKQFSEKYQWLPSDVTISVDGKCKIQSYINNLNPKKFRDLYRTLENILERFIPLFNNVLTEMINPKPRRQEVSMEHDELYGPTIHNEDTGDTGDNWDDDDDTQEATAPQAVGEFQPHSPENIVNLNGRKLQVIFKLANIVLTPDSTKSVYNGGVWHVEGMRNENIVASGIYYWQTENITESKLSFRTNVREPEYTQNDNKGVKAVYGLENEDSLVQNIGNVTCIQGRSLCWPNTLQHQVQNFSLKDPKKPGVRKILVFFLVDPNVRIVSTVDIPRQKSYVTREMANQIREDLMHERKYFTDEHTKKCYERDFSLCEH
jgi:hypothetical protein